MTITTGRCWPPTGLTTTRWMVEVPVEEVPLEQLHLVQDRLEVAGLLNAVDGGLPMHGDAIPHVIEWDGRLFVEDGHHRVVAAEIARRFGIGPSTITARVRRC